MKKSLFILAAAALTLASCSSDETTAVNDSLMESNEISFRPFVNGVTRTANAAGLKTTWETNDKLYINAIRTVSGTKKFYFQDQFIKDATGFNSANKHYWPADLSTNNITFTGFWGVEYKSITNSYTEDDEYLLKAAYSVEDDVTNQMDILFAQSAAINAKPDGGGVALNFRHMLSQIVVQVANTEANLDIDITGVMIGNVNKTGTFKYTAVTETTAGGNLTSGDWTGQATSQSYTQSSTATLTSNDDGNVSLTSYTPCILMPQQLTPATAYSASGSTTVESSTVPAVNGSYIALQMAIKDAKTDIPVVAKQWCIWPINTQWVPGYKYTYTVNAGSGGYQPVDQNSNKDLDPVLKNTVIWFLPTCTIDAWDNEAITVTSETFAAAGTYSYSIGASAATYSITVSGLTASEAVTLTLADGTLKTNGATVSGGSNADSDGNYTFTLTAPINDDGSDKTGTITVTGGTSSKTATINVTQAH